MNSASEQKILVPGASAEEAAAVVAALGQFMRDTGTARADESPTATEEIGSAWLAAALAEGVARDPGVAPGVGRTDVASGIGLVR
jgi:hypothetical protein